MDVTLRGYHAELGISPTYAENTRLPFHPTPDDLVDIGLDCYGRPQSLRSDAAAAWHAMREDASMDSIQLLVVSAYRSLEYQVEVIRRQLDDGKTIEDILTRVAAPGFSEHHSGCALDLTTPGYEAVEEEFESSPAFKWLVTNASKHGFHLSYPRDNPFGVIYEPWHWCYSE
ncbi:MAG: M15 family metallopeptidase [Gammaproteobacteria bacterium]|nr:M15 family metallopeptidase [Gammaproteobacteria bacterium]